MATNRGRLGLLAASLVWLAQGCSRDAIEDAGTVLPSSLRGETASNVVLYVMDTARLDRFSLYGFPLPTTPHLEDLAKRSTVFANAYAPGPSTTPSITAMFASRLPSELRGRIEPQSAPRTLAESFRDAGYATAAFQGNVMLRGEFGFARGFDDYLIQGTRRSGRLRPRSAEEIHRDVQRWLGENSGRPFFVYIQTMDVHEYRPPPELAERFAVDPVDAPWFSHLDLFSAEEARQLRSYIQKYHATLAYADREFAAFLDGLEVLGLSENTLVLLTADHGEGLGQRGQISHGSSLYEELVHVPMLLFAPWRPEPDRVDAVVSLMDVAPTLLDLVGIGVPDSFDGKSLLRAPDDDSATAFGALMGGAWKGQKKHPPAWYIRRGNWKLIAQAGDAPRLYDLAADPGELRDVASEHPEVDRELRLELALAFPRLGQDASEPHPLEADLDPAARLEFEEALRALGYVE